MKPRTEKLVNAAFVVALLVGAGLVGWRAMSLSEPVATPEVFSQPVTFRQALERSAEQGKPVFLVATADWCGPCQTYKRHALASPAVKALIEERFIPVLLDVTQGSELGERLKIESIPATLVIKQGAEADRRVGALSERVLLEFLRRASGG